MSGATGDRTSNPKGLRPAEDWAWAWAWHLDEVRAEITRYRIALNNIAAGPGYYGAQAREYKNIAREALRMEKLL